VIFVASKDLRVCQFITQSNRSGQVENVFHEADVDEKEGREGKEENLMCT
jgi:hypothetical protein